MLSSHFRHGFVYDKFIVEPFHTFFSTTTVTMIYNDESGDNGDRKTGLGEILCELLHYSAILYTL